MTGSPTIFVATAILAVALLALSAYDLRSHRLPDWLTLPLIPAGWLAAWLMDLDVVLHLLGAAIGYGAFVLLEITYNALRGRAGLGRGDAKLLAAGGAWCGAFALPVGVPPGDAESLIAQAADWIDADRTPRPGGAEDDTYLARSEPFRAANQPFAELSELRLLPVMNRALYMRAAPYLCVLPTSVQPALNVNTLRREEAVLITAITEGTVSVQAAEQALFRRPTTGFESLEAFWADPAFAPLNAEERPASAVALRSEWFELQVEVRLGEARLSRIQTVRMDRAGRFSRLTPVQGAVL